MWLTSRLRTTTPYTGESATTFNIRRMLVSRLRSRSTWGRRGTFGFRLERSRSTIGRSLTTLHRHHPPRSITVERSRFRLLPSEQTSRRFLLAKGQGPATLRRFPGMALSLIAARCRQGGREWRVESGEWRVESGESLYFVLFTVLKVESEWRVSGE